MNCNMKSIFKAIPVYLVVMSVLTLSAMAGGRVVSFGYYTDLPSQNRDMVAVAAGYMHSLALTDDEEVVAWGDNSRGQLNVPGSCDDDIEAIAAGGYHSMALDDDGRVFAWGDNSAGQSTVPSSAKSNIRAISAGLLHSLALHKNGKVYAWGDSMFSQIYVPAGLDKVIAISAGALHSMALRNDGMVFIWGDNSFDQGTVPEAAMSGIKAIAAGYFHNLALTTEGEVIAWGQNDSGQCNVPDEARYGVVAISAGQDHSLALKADGRLISWGGRAGKTQYNDSSTIPNLSSISAGGFHSLGIVPEEADSNNNGIPDWWEIQNSLDPAAAIDPKIDSDRDGLTDHEEYLTGTDPWDNASFFKAELALNPVSGTPEMVFSPVSTDRLYTLEYTADVTSGSWRTVSGMANMQMLSNTEPGRLSISPDKSFRIYRIKTTTITTP